MAEIFLLYKIQAFSGFALKDLPTTRINPYGVDYPRSGLNMHNRQVLRSKACTKKNDSPILQYTTHRPFRCFAPQRPAYNKV
jgi:hypothetical protein